MTTVLATPHKATHTDSAAMFAGPRILIVGAGPVGTRCASELRKRFQLSCNITVFGDEPYAPYDRIKLTQLLAGSIHYPDIFWSQDDSSPGHPDTQIDFHNASIQSIDTVTKIARDAMGNAHTYDYLIIATGSKPHIPNIEGISLPGVYTFRNIRDTEQLLARINRTRHVVVVGGGLLGLEAARGLLKSHTQVTLVHQAPRLMNRQLSDEPAEELLRRVKKLGINVITNDGLGRVHGDSRVTGITTRTGKKIDCDTVVMCTGIKPNVALALASGLAFNRGVLIDEKLKTSANCVYAIGECCEFNGEIYGLVAPGLEQATVLATNLAGGEAHFVGSQPYTKLKVMDAQVNSMGEVADLIKRPKLHTLNNRKKQQSDIIYSRSLVVHRGKIIGACGVGAWPELQRIREAFLQGRYIFPWQQLLFVFTGRLWFTAKQDNVTQWPASALVCQCNQVTRGTLDSLINNGATSIKAIGSCCGATTVCGSCLPLVENLIQAKGLATDAANDNSLSDSINTTSTRWLLITSLIAIAASLGLWLMPGLNNPQSVQEFSIAFLWTDSFYKQVSGFSLLGVTLFGLFLSLRKRFRWTFLGNFNSWRLVHTFFGVLALAILFLHTGANMGENLNRLLMTNFLLAAAVGSVLGIIIGSKRVAANNPSLRKFSFWMHVLTVWPLPVLVSAHIVSSYYF